MIQSGSFMRRQGVTMHQKTLDNGVRVVHFERPGAPINLWAVFRSGSRYDPGGKDGLAHFVEHMLCTDSNSTPLKDRWAVRIGNIGGTFGATTGNASVTIQVGAADAADFPAAATVLSEILHNPLQDNEVFANERGAILRELGNRLSSPAESLMYDFWPLFFDGDKVGRTILGSEKTISAITLDDIRKFFTSQLTLDRMTLVSAGGITISDLTATLEHQHFLPSPLKSPQFVKAPEPKGGKLHIRHFGNNDQIDFLYGFRVNGLASNDLYALRILQHVLGGGFVSRLMRRLRFDKGYIYTGRAFLMPRTDDEGIFIFKSACAKKNLQETLNIIGDEFSQVYQGKVGREEIALAKDTIIKSQIMNMQTSEDWVDFHAMRAIFAPERTVDDYVAGVAACTLKDVMQAGQMYFRPGTQYVGLAGDVAEQDVKINY